MSQAVLMTTTAIQVILLHPVNAIRYRGYTTRALQPRLGQLLSVVPSHGTGYVAFGAETSGTAVGLILAEVEGNAAIVFSLHVARSYRRRGVAAQLLQKLECFLHASGVERLTMSFPLGGEFSEAMLQLTGNADWVTEPGKTLYWAADWQKFHEATWLYSPALTSGFSICRWCDTVDSQRQALLDEASYPEWADPFRESSEDTFEPLNSLALCHSKRIVGWLITQRMSSQLLRYSIAYAEPRFQRTGRLIPVIARAILLAHHPKTGAGIPEGSWGIEPQATRMVRFARRHLRPYVSKITLTCTATKRIDSPS